MLVATRGEVGIAHHLVDLVEEGASLVDGSIDFDFLEGAIGVHRDGGMEEEVAVADEVERALLIEQTQVLLEFGGVAERVGKLIHDLLFARTEVVGVGDVEQRGQVLVEQLIHLSVEGDGACTRVDLVEHQAVVHLVFGMATDDLSFELELDDGDGLVHLGHELCGTLETRVVVEILGLPKSAGVVAIDFHGEVGEGEQVDAIAFLKGLDVGVAYRYAEHGGDECEVAGGCTHPFDVVVAPLQVEVVVTREGVHDLPGSRTTVEDIADDVELVDDETVDEVADGDDERLASTDFDHGVDDGVVVVLPVGFALCLIEEFGDDVGEFGFEEFLELRTRVFVVDEACHLDDLVDGHAIPVVEVLGILLFLDEFELVLRVVDECAQLALVAVAHGQTKNVVHLAAYLSGGIAQDVVERFGLAMDVTEEVLGALREAHDGLQVDDFGGDAVDGRELLAQELKVTLIGSDFFECKLHVDVVFSLLKWSRQI